MFCSFAFRCPHAQTLLPPLAPHVIAFCRSKNTHWQTFTSFNSRNGMNGSAGESEADLDDVSIELQRDATFAPAELSRNNGRTDSGNAGSSQKSDSFSFFSSIRQRMQRPVAAVKTQGVAENPTGSAGRSFDRVLRLGQNISSRQKVARAWRPETSRKVSNCLKLAVFDRIFLYFDGL